MEIEIKNFGPISYLKFDLSKDIHLIYGKNAIGKSYATYLIYCLLKTLKNKTRQFISFPQRTESSAVLEELLTSNINRLNPEEKIDISKLANDLLQSRIGELIIPALENSLMNTFSSLDNLKNQFSTSNFEIQFLYRKNELASIYLNEDNKLNFRISFEDIKVEIRKGEIESSLFVQYLNMASSTTLTEKDTISKEVVEKLGQFILANFPLWDDTQIKDIYFLPASRSGLYQALSAIAPIIAELTQNRFFLETKKIDLPGLPEPVSDYFIDLSTVDNKQLNNQFTDAVHFLEERILRGEVDYEDQSKKIVFRPVNTSLELNLSEASSMVSELSPLVIFLKHILTNKYNGSLRQKKNGSSTSSASKENQGSDILFIEEPEAHLHPEVQVLLVELFAMLSKQGIKIFMTSHSNYMFNKLNNMLIGGQLDESKVEVYHLISSPEGTIRNPNMHVSSEGIDDENFQETSEKLYLERMALLEAQNDK